MLCEQSTSCENTYKRNPHHNGTIVFINAAFCSNSDRKDSFLLGFDGIKS
jgi:hypothetical protein